MKIIINESQLNFITENIDPEVYFPTFTAAVQHARERVESRGFVVDDDDWWNEVNTGQGRPKEGNTTRMTIGLYKNEKPQRKALHMQVYNRGNQIDNNYELNYYVA